MLNLLIQLIQFTDQKIELKKQQTVETSLSIYVRTKYLSINKMFVYLDLFKMQLINYRPDWHNLQTRPDKAKTEMKREH